MAKASLPNSNSKIKICTAVDCDRLSFSRGYCQKHYTRMRKYGDPNAYHTHGRPFSDPVPRFWANVEKTSTCWVWKGGNAGGYGTFFAYGKPVLAHRFSFRLATGIDSALDILHSCDNPLCVNPDHLREGTHAENMADRQNRNRQVKGEASGRAILTEQDVLTIRDIYRKHSRTHGTIAIARRYGVSVSTITAIVTGRSWRHLNLPIKKFPVFSNAKG